jgi:hypothetical protein
MPVWGFERQVIKALFPGHAMEQALMVVEKRWLAMAANLV